jgi:hypothetical protein
LDQGRLGAFQRQTKYKLQAMMELGLITDDRNSEDTQEYKIGLSPLGYELYRLIKELNPSINYSFREGKEAVPSWDMTEDTKYFNSVIRTVTAENQRIKSLLYKIFLQVPAVIQMLNYLYRIERRKSILKSEIYSRFFKTPFVMEYCDQEGIDTATDTSAEHRCPFLINIIDALALIDQKRDSIEVKKLLICISTMKFDSTEGEDIIQKRITNILKFKNDRTASIDPYEESRLKENFGANFLTDMYYLDTFEVFKE